MRIGSAKPKALLTAKGCDRSIDGLHEDRVAMDLRGLELALPSIRLQQHDAEAGNDRGSPPPMS